MALGCHGCGKAVYMWRGRGETTLQHGESGEARRVFADPWGAESREWLDVVHDYEKAWSLLKQAPRSDDR